MVNIFTGKLTPQFIPGWTDEVAQGHPLKINSDLVTTFANIHQQHDADEHSIDRRLL